MRKAGERHLVVSEVEHVVAPAGAVPVWVRLRDVVLGSQNVVDDDLSIKKSEKKWTSSSIHLFLPVGVRLRDVVLGGKNVIDDDLEAKAEGRWGLGHLRDCSLIHSLDCSQVPPRPVSPLRMGSPAAGWARARPPRAAGTTRSSPRAR